MKLTLRYANLVYDILVKECGAYEGDPGDFSARSTFVYFLTNGRMREYRFQGSLGFGGKYYPDEWRVGYYQEDRTKEREAMQEKANAALEELRKQYTDECSFIISNSGLWCAILCGPACGCHAQVVNSLEKAYKIVQGYIENNLNGLTEPMKEKVLKFVQAGRMEAGANEFNMAFDGQKAVYLRQSQLCR